jgi:DNA modification methylase
MAKIIKLVKEKNKKIQHSLKSKQRHSLNAICPYFTMFPIEYPLRILKRLPNTRGVIDPFCGRGTTLYAARTMGIESWGIDSSPVAVAIAKAKLSNSTVSDAVSLAKRILRQRSNPDVPNGVFWEFIFHPDVLIDITRLRAALMNDDSGEASLLRAIILGCLHGPLTKNPENPSYLSNQMPRTFSSKPEYSVRFWKKHRLTPNHLSVLGVIEKKALRLNIDCLPNNVIGGVIQGNSELPETFLHIARDIDTIITSPPYYGMKSYVQDQWLRNWFLGGPATIDYKKGGQISHSGVPAFVESLSRVWRNIGNLPSQRKNLYMRIGAIPSKKVNPIDITRQSLDASGHRWRILSVKNAGTPNGGKRQAETMRVRSTPVSEYDVHAILG